MSCVLGSVSALPSGVIPRVDNCLFILREDQEGPVFYHTPPNITPNLDGYAIIPRDEYQRLKDIAGEKI